MNVLRINTAKAYDMVIGRNILQETAALVRKVVPQAKKIMIVSDDNVFPLYGAKVAESLCAGGFAVFSHVIPHGEHHKNLETYGRLLNELSEAYLTRSDAVIALGGGVVGDLAGFAAATYQRGIALVQMPTTLLAAVDSSVGGKTALDLPSGKNQVGCFYQPDLVLCDADTLATLPEAEYRNGCAEIIKYAVLDGTELFSMLRDVPVSEQYEAVIARCVDIKRCYVETDEHDNGLRMLLNLGHTVGHAVETCSNYEIAHGQAVAIGLAAIVRAGAEKGHCGKTLSNEVTELLRMYDLPTEIPFPVEALTAAAASDKKNTAGSMRLIVPFALGDCRVLTIDRIDFDGWLKAGGVE